MAFTVNDYQDLISLLEEHPEWRTDLRRLLLADDILELPRITRELAESHRAALVRLDRIEQVLAQLVSAQELTAQHVADLRGWRVETNYRERPYAYFGTVMRKARSVRPDDLPEVEQARDSGRLTDQEWAALMVTDAIIRGRVGSGVHARDVYLVLETSFVVDRTDVTRATERAAILKKVGLNAVPVVGGQSILSEAEQLARQLKVAVSADGALTYWPESA